MAIVVLAVTMKTIYLLHRNGGAEIQLANDSVGYRIGL